MIHYDLTPSLEEFYQEAGRAGRDGKPSYAVLLSSKTDRALLHRRITESFPERPVIKETYEQICNHLHFSIGEGYEAVREFDIGKFCQLFEKQEKQCRASLRLLSQAGYMQFIEEAEKRSRLKILCEREELYEIKYPGKYSEKVLSMALRLYTGLFSDFVYIRESEIAYHLKLTETDVYQALLELDKMKIINFIPRSGLPMIYMPTSREERSSLIIGKNIYEDRKSIMKDRIEAVLDYTFKDKSCRVKRMLAYFGETDAKDCGKCDVCREKNKTGSVKYKKEQTINSIMSVLKSHPEGLRYVSLETLCGGNKSIISNCLAFLCNEGFVKYSGNLYFWN